MKPRQYESLVVWKEAHSLCIDTYKLLPDYPMEERFCLCNQMRRSASSVPTNIVEGNIKRSAKEKLRFIEIAEGSLEELDYQFILSRDLGYITSNKCDEFRGKTRKVFYLLSKFREGIQGKESRG